MQVFEEQVTRRGDATALTFKRDGAWQTVSWKELARRVRDVADGLASLGVKAGDRVAILADTCAEWIIADVAIMSAGAITVPIYQSNPAHECQYILARRRGLAGSSWTTSHQAAKIREEARQAARPARASSASSAIAEAALRAHPGRAGERPASTGASANPGAHAARVAAREARRPGLATSTPRAPPATPRAWCSPTAPGSTRPRPPPSSSSSSPTTSSCSSSPWPTPSPR